MTCLRGEFEVNVTSGGKLILPKPFLRIIFDGVSDEKAKIVLRRSPELMPEMKDMPALKCWPSIPAYKDQCAKYLNQDPKTKSPPYDSCYGGSIIFYTYVDRDGGLIIPEVSLRFIGVSGGLDAKLCLHGTLDSFNIMTPEVALKSSDLIDRLDEEGGGQDPLCLLLPRTKLLNPQYPPAHPAQSLPPPPSQSRP